ncbi:CRAL/TRIO domain-containing protein [Trametes coccinea BRFM310]|uniref:CRAL/TRIO domain-containing protein n=1 Tax=Trametes coccinea (strain BRFM310) TaxID=1353009 RepID=A0A1Y2J0V6_TRAC3|nr:CRAL/TRIO domain-containing protein [Trametes coccinea BRFM310]
MSIYEQLRAQQELLVGLYEQNIEGAVRLQKTLAEDILPGLVDELGLDEDDTTRAREWLNDQESIFRIYKRHKFTVPFALEHARDTLLWRLASIPTTTYRHSASLIRCLPLTCRDPFERPILIIRVAEILRAPGDVREVLVHHMEQLRLNLKALNEGTNPGDTDGEFVPILQYVALFDIANISVQDTNMDLITWFIFELIPRFPGMLAAVCVLNYSWAHSGVWGLVKRVLPKSALSRIFFPSRDELLQYIPRSALPQEYGGTLSTLSELEDPLENVIAPPCELPQPSSSEDSTPHQASSSGLQPIPRIGSIPPTSHLNPYFGYPVSGRNTLTPRLRHGRQRKRDLLRTLASLWWSRWKHRVYALLCIALALVIVTSRRRPRIFGWKQPCAGRAKINIAGLRIVSTAAETNWVWVWSGRGASMPSADVEVVALLAKTV